MIASDYYQKHEERKIFFHWPGWFEFGVWNLELANITMFKNWKLESVL